MEIFAVLSRAEAGFAAALSSVREDQWSLPTPCEAWDVRRLVDHVVAGAGFYVALLGGGGPVPPVLAGGADHLGEDPLGASALAAGELAAAFAAPGALERVVHHPAGELSGARLAAVRVAELVLHGADLRRALDAPAEVDDGLAAFVLPHLEAMGLGRRGSVAFKAPTAPASAGASPGERLLVLSGRRP